MNLQQAASMNNLQIISIAVLWAFKRGCELFTESPETQLELSKKIPSGLIWKSQPYPYREVELQVKYTVKRLGFLCVGWQRGEGGWLRCVSLTVHRAQRGFVTGSWITGRLIWPWRRRWIFAWLLLRVPWTAGWDGCKKTPRGPREANWGCATTGTQVCAQSPKPAPNQPQTSHFSHRPWCGWVGYPSLWVPSARAGLAAHAELCLAVTCWQHQPPHQSPLGNGVLLALRKAQPCSWGWNRNHTIAKTALQELLAS